MDMLPPVTSAQMLQEELALLRAGHEGARRPSPDPQDELRAALDDARSHRLSALCLSGGGVRSASFATGLLEGLARRGRLESFDYLSTVSGGGYAGAWLSAWRYHARRTAGASVPPPQPWPDTPREPGGSSEPEPLIRLRRYTRFLAPHEGVFSIDLWSMFATMGRNLLLNWMVLFPVLAGLLLVPYLYYAGVRLLDRELVAGAGLWLSSPATWVLLGSGALIGTAILYIGHSLPSLGGHPGTQRRFLAWCLAPLCAGALGLTLFWAMDEVPIHAAPTIAATAALSPLLWILAGLASRRRWRPNSWIAAVISGATAGAGLWFLTTGPFGPGHALRQGYATLAFPLILGLILLATVLQIGLSRSETTDEDLEWWSRFGAWLMVVGIAWIGLSLIVFWGPVAMNWVAHDVIGLAEAPGALVSGIVGVLATSAGGIAALSGRAVTADPEGKRWLPRVVAAAAIPTFAFLLLTFLALINLKVIHGLSTGSIPLGETISSLQAGVHFMEATVLAVVFLAFGTLMALLFPVNKFSLNGMYRNRLVRSFVGAARPAEERSPSPFTDFDPNDDLAMAELAGLGRPLHLVNATLNMVADRHLSEQQRKAEPFTFTPLHCGSWKLGYRPSGSYAGGAGSSGGVTLGTAATVSGAAASPNMGARSSPALTFLLTLFNARLGAWFGNPGAAGASTWQDAEPHLGPWLLLKELFGDTTDRSRYVFLSDGGHFENLGLYEMVRRRCHLIVVSDASCDPEYAFDDLSNAIRMIRIDFSIPIVFPEGVPIGVRRDPTGAPAAPDSGAVNHDAHLAVGRILYSAVDGPDAQDGTLIYLKTTLTGDEPMDVVNYARSHPAFPHESTANQFFSEAQFESYRALGLHTVDRLFLREGRLESVWPDPVEAR